jgi:hypothetical protein
MEVELTILVKLDKFKREKVPSLVKCSVLKDLVTFIYT